MRILGFGALDGPGYIQFRDPEVAQAAFLKYKLTENEDSYDLFKIQIYKTVADYQKISKEALLAKIPIRRILHQI